ncbi:uncharacterized protein LOC125038227 [Penaeus chinensis]|uniref:uncharacterized protein LOC125038227 n=1 Tax=Penaeus chinensis TaxID=139456 RepID=UPI001FB6373D|nr:uncharacterized protein LOC125038227 [Penaeus chinensis]
MDKCLKTMVVMLLAAPLVLALPTATEVAPVSEEDEELVPFFDLAANDSDAENGTVRVFLFPGSASHSQQSFGAYPYPQNTGFINFPGNQRPSYQGTGYYPFNGLYPYSQDCTYWCVQNVGFSREVYCCRQ